MNTQSVMHNYLDVTDTLARLYLFLAQRMDRCVSEAARAGYPEAELQTHLDATKATVLDMLSGNPVVQAKVEQECHRVQGLIMVCQEGGATNAVALDELKAERVILTHKTMALSDLLAVFRAP